MVRALHLILALVIALTAQTFALARGQTMASGQIVLCLGGQAVTVVVDENGQPTGPAHICPDMALSLMAGVNFDVVLPPPVFGPSARVVVLVSRGGLPIETVAPSARGPPLSV